MCRIASFPPNFSREKAIEVLLHMEGRNIDGVGSTYVRDGKFIVEKYPRSLTQVLKDKNSFLAHLPYTKGWTIVHLRAASHGCNAHRNTHPFVVGNWAVIHNGIWSEYNVVKLALEKGLGTKFQGETDSEVAAHLFNLAGPLKFSQEIDRGGVFIALNRNGELHAVKTSGDLAIVTLPKRRVLLSSEFDFQTYPRSIEAVLGWYHFDKHGCFIKAKGKKFETPASWGYSQYPSNGISAYTTYVPSFVPQSILTGKRNEEISKRPLSFHDRDWTDDAGSMYD